MQLRETVAKNLKALREARRFTQGEIAKELSVKQPVYAQYEIGRYEMKYDIMKKLSTFHQVSINSLLGMEGEFKTVGELLKKYEDF